MVIPRKFKRPNSPIALFLIKDFWGARSSIVQITNNSYYLIPVFIKAGTRIVSS